MSEFGDNTFSFGHGDGHIGSKSKAWKAEGGSTYRLSFAWWPLDGDGLPNMGAPGEGKAPLFSGGPTNFIQGVGYILNQGAEFTKLAGEPPRQRIVTVVVVWPTDKKGNLDKGRLASGDFEVKPWVISSEKYKTLELLHHEFALGEHDITAKCEEGGTQFQKLIFTPCKENLYRQFLAAGAKGAPVVQRIKDEVAAIVSGIQEFVGRKMTIQQIREKLNQGGGAPVARDAGDSAVPSGDIENLVGGLLDQ